MVRLTSLLPFVPALVLAASSVQDLLPTNFDSVVLKSNKPALVEFFAPWCGHCKTLAPIYEELATTFASQSDKVSIAKVDADEHKSLGRRFGVQGFPTLKWFDGKSDKPEDYKGGRDLESLTKFITEKTGVKPKAAKKPTSDVTMLDDKKFKELVGGEKSAFIAFTAPWCGHCKTLAPIWEQVATDFKNDPNVLIAKVDAEAENSKATAQAQSVTSYPTILWFPANTTTPLPFYTGGRDEASIVEYVNEHAGTYRLPGGGLNAKAGTIDTLNAIAARFSNGGDKVMAELTEAVGIAKEVGADYYAKVAKKAGANKEYVEKELKRLEGLLKKGGLAPEKVDDLVRRSNVLRIFKGESTKDEL